VILGHDGPVAELRVRVLGGLAVETVEPAALGSRKQRRLLARLILARGGVVSSDELADDLWGEAQPAQPRDQLSVLVSRLRSALPDDALTRRDAGYTLTVGWSDLAALAERQQEAIRRATEEHWASAAEAARAALALLRGRVLPELADAPWVAAEQTAVDNAAQQMRLVLARAELAVGDPRLAADVAREALIASPYDEVALRLHLDACLAARTPALGLATFATARNRLADDLGVDPSPETLAAYERLLHATGPDEPAAPVSAGAPAGRAGELGRALHAIDAAGHGTPSLTAFVGEAGIGKSCVLRAVATATSHQVVWAQCDELGRVLPLQPIVTALAGVLRLRTTDDLRALLSADAPVVAPLLGLESSSQAIGQPDAGTGQLLVQAALVRVLDRLAGTGAVVLLVDDAHHADPATAALLAGIPRGASRVAVFVAARAGEGPDWPDGTVVELGPLDVDAVAQVVGADRAASLHARSGGHPLLLTELAASDDDAVPDGLRAAFAAAADSAGRAGVTLRAASVLGPDLDLDVLAEVLRRPAVELLDDLETGVRRRLLVEDPSGFRFRHSLVREALAADVGPTRRALLHRETARALQARGHGDPLILATHARAGGAADIAADAFAQAAQIAAGRQAHEEALRLADESLRSSPQHRNASLLKARELLVLGRYAEAAAAARTAADNGAGAAAIQVGGLAAHYQRDWKLALELVDRAADEAADPDVRATSLAASAHIRHAVGDLPGAEARFAAAEEAASERSRVPQGWVALLRQHQGRSEETLALTERGSESTLLEQFTLPMAQMSRGLAFAALGRSAEALACFDTMDEAVDRFGVVRYAGRVENCRGYVLRNLGQHQLADDLNQAGRESAMGIGTAEPVAHAVLDLAEGRLRAGDLDAVAKLLDDAEVFGAADQHHAFQWRHRARAGWLRGRLHLALGEVDEASACAAGVIEEASRSDVPRYAAFGQLLAVQARIAGGEPPTTAQVLATVDRLSSLAGMEQLWLVQELAHASGGQLRTALGHRARDAADRLVANSPADLFDAVRVHAATLTA
jgi:DNA-binding SARP family transcriptional activator